MAYKSVPCANGCGGLMDARSHVCRKCAGHGRRVTPEGLYARELNITVRTLRALGGEARLRSLSPDARAILLIPQLKIPNGELHRGGLTARGLHPRTAHVNRDPHAQPEVSA